MKTLRIERIPESATLRVYDHVYAILRRGIATGQIPPGSRLVELEVADQIGVSRTPVREALRRLESDGFVERVSPRGLTVTPMGPDELGDIGRLRAQIDGLAASLATERATDDDWKGLEGLVERLAGTEDTPIVDFHQTHVDFHRAIYRIGFSPRLSTYLESHLLEYIETSGMNYLGPPLSRFEIIEQHRELLRAFTSGDADLAAAAAESHARIAADRMVRGRVGPGSAGGEGLGLNQGPTSPAPVGFDWPD
jgi:DNA-binding GntR family transcriptional regulator